MSLTTITTPEITFSTIDSEAVSVSQVRWTYYRKDGTFTTVSKTGGNKLIIDDYSLKVASQVGDRIYVKFDDEVVNSEGVITAKSAGPAFLITTDIDYSSATTARVGFANNFDLITNYRVKATIAEYPDYEFFFTSGAGGVVAINLGIAIKNIILINDLTYSDITMSRTELWDASSESPTAEAEILCTLSIRQILSEHGANLWDYLLKPTPVADLLTRDIGKYWDGWKRSISCIVDPDISTRLVNAIEFVFRNYDENKVSGSLISTHGITKTPNRIHEREIPAGTSYFIEALVRDDVTLAALSNEYFYQILDECRKPIMIEWLNSFGAWEQHLFQLNQTFNIEAKTGIIHDIGIDDNIEDITGTKGRIPDGYTQTITLQADQLTRNQLIALNEIKYSNKVRIFLEKDGSAFVDAVVFGGYGDDFNTKGVLFEFFLSLQLPDNFNLFDHLGYSL